MRGDVTEQAEMLLPLTPDSFVPPDHPIRLIKTVVDRVLRELSPVFTGMYAEGGRPSIPPEHLLKALLLKSLYSVRSERQLCERIHYDLLFKWFLDLNISSPAFDPTSFTKNRDRLPARAACPSGEYVAALVAAMTSRQSPWYSVMPSRS